ncbi:Ba228 [Baboon cytomegalovirus]|nr:Ba228 [Baboon cytomegalovirus]
MWHAAIILYEPALTACAARALGDALTSSVIYYHRFSMLCARCRRRPATESDSNNARSSQSEASQRRQTRENQKEPFTHTSLVGRALVVVGQQLVAANLGACPPPVPLFLR